jgi:N-methylhydantoinase A
MGRRDVHLHRFVVAGYDETGIFGTPGASLTGDSFTLTYTSNGQQIVPTNGFSYESVGPVNASLTITGSANNILATGTIFTLSDLVTTFVVGPASGDPGTIDVSVVLRGETPITRETWIGTPYQGQMTGFPSVDVKSVGAGGGSIAWIDEGGMLHVGPQSAASSPGPVCYGRGAGFPQ